MPEAIIGLVGVIVGAAISALTSYFTASKAWSRDQILSLHEELVQLHVAKWPGQSWHDVRVLLARVRARMVLLGHDPRLLDGFEERLARARGSAEEVPGWEVGEESDEAVWMMDSEKSRAVDEQFDELMKSMMPRVRRWRG